MSNNPFKLILKIFNKDHAQRARLLVHYNVLESSFSHFECIYELSERQMYQALEQIIEATKEIRNKRNQTELKILIDKSNKKAAITQKLLGKVSEWKKQSQLVLPKEEFQGQSDNSLFTCQMKGNFEIQRIIFEPQQNIKADHHALNQAISKAEQTVSKRWKDALQGALEQELNNQPKIQEHKIESEKN